MFVSDSDDNNIAKAQKNQALIDFLKQHNAELKQKIENAKHIEFLLNLPFPTANVGESAIANMVIADAGAGKSLLVRGIIGNALEQYKNDIFVYIDLEFQEQIAKERKFQDLFKYDNFIYIDTDLIDKLREKYKVKVTATAIKSFIKDLVDAYKESRVIVFIDSFEDFIEDTSNDTELKRMFQGLLSIKSLTVNFSHHITKDEMKSKNMKFRGSMVIKAKLSSLVFLNEKIQQDMDITMSLEVLKMRAFYEGSNAITVTMNTENYNIKTIDIVADKEEIAILKTIYFTLLKEKRMKKTELRDAVRDKTRKSRAKVEAVLAKYSNFFDISVGEKNTQFYAITTNVEMLDKYLAVCGLGNSTFSEIKQNLFDTCKSLQLSNIQQIAEIRTSLANGSIRIYTNISSILNSIYQMSDDEADEVLQSLSLQFSDT